jgi:hypothetical protein
VVAPVFTDEELESLRRFPEIGREELFRFFTLPPADSAFIDPPAAVARLAEQLRVDPEEIRSSGRRAKTRTDHLRLAAQYLGGGPRRRWS